MAVHPWLDRFRKRLKNHHARRARSSSALSSGRSAGVIERMETRTLLASTVLVVGTELQVLADSGEDVTVVEDPNLTEHVEVQIDGSRAAGMPVIRADAIETLTIQTGDTENTVDLSGVASAVFTNLSQIRVSTANGHDTVIGSPDFGETIDTGDGDDTIDGSGGNDSILAGDGNDVVTGGDGDDTIDAGDGDDNVTGDAGMDEILGDDGDDTLDGGTEADSIVAGDGTDVVTGGTDNDTLFGDLGDDNIDGNAGNDLVFAGGGNDVVNGSDGADSLFGNGGGDSIDGGDGDDSIKSGNGNDTVLAGMGQDFIDGGIGNDSLDGQEADDTINAGGGDDFVLGDGNDLAMVSFGNDLILGQSGDDTLIGTGGADTIIGGAGDDLIRSQPEGAALIAPPPPAPPVPPPPPPPAGLGNVNAAMGTGAAGALGTTTVLSTGMADGNTSFMVDGVGELLQTTFFDPLGPPPPAGSFLLFDSDLWFRTGLTGPRTEITTGSVGASPALSGNGTEANSSFSFQGLDFTLVQTATDLLDTGSNLIGGVLNQTYTITNPGASQVDFEFVRYIENHMFSLGGFAGNDGGGVLQTGNGVDLYFESAGVFDPTQELIFGGITGEGGTPITQNRFEIGPFGSLVFGTISQGNALGDVLNGDTDGDGFIEMPSFDQEIALRNAFSLAPGASTTYTTNTAYGTLLPAPPNQPPVAVNDTEQAFNATSLTIDLVSNDSDPDGALDFGTINILTPPQNGTVTVLGDGRVTYTPDPLFSGTDSFTYNIMDNQGAVSNPATVTITVLAGDEGDFLDGSEGEDTIVGAAGDDTIVGGLNDDLAMGGPGDDSMLGGAGDDTLEGERGNDTLIGQGGNDELNGGEGEDTLIWRGDGDGHDILDGGDGGNIVQINLDDTGNVVTVGEDMSGRLLISESMRSATIEPNVSAVVINAGDGQDKITIGEIDSTALARLTINGDEDHDRIDASGANIGSVRLEINGGIGADTLTGSNGADLIDGGDDDDEISAGPGNDTVLGGLGPDTVDAGTGDDSVNGGDGNDVINGADGNDIVDGGNDADTVNGDGGDDTLRGNFGDDSLIGSFGDDSVLGGLGQDDLIGGAGNDFLNGGRNNDIVLGNSGNDTLIGDHGNDFLRGDAGDDEILGGDGDDNIRAGDGDDGIDAGDGDDQVIGDNGSDTILGGDGDDTLLGGGAKDTLLGQEGADQLNGNGGTDLGALGQGDDLTPVNVEIIFEDFVLTAEMLEALDGM